MCKKVKKSEKNGQKGKISEKNSAAGEKFEKFFRFLKNFAWILQRVHFNWGKTLQGTGLKVHLKSGCTLKGAL